MARREVLVFRTGDVATMTFNRPPSNLIDRGLLSALSDALGKILKDASVRALVLTGSDTVFSEGLDIEAFEMLESEEQRELVKLGQDALWELEHAPMPTIAAIAGKAMGAGLELALACDMRVADEDAQFGHPEVSQGIVPMFGNAFRLEGLIGKSRSRSMIFFGEPIPAWEALEIGLVGRVAPHGSILEGARIAATRIAAQPPDSVRAAKRAMLSAEERGCRESLDEVVRSLAQLRKKNG